MRPLSVLLIVLIGVASVFGAFVPRAHAWAIAAYPSSRTTVPGGTVTYSISVYHQAPEIPPPSVTLLVSPPLTGVTVNFSPESGALSFDSLMTVHVDGSKPAGSYVLNIWAHPTGTPFPGPDNKATSVQLVVQSATPGVTDWVLLNPSLSPATPHVGDPVTFHVTLAALSTNQPYPQSVTVLAQIDSDMVGGGTVDYPGPTGSSIDLYSTPPWTATVGAHTITWKVTSGSEDPNTSNNQVSLSFSVGQVPQQFDFTVSVSPSGRAVTGSGVATYTVTVNRISGSSQTVTLSLVGAPSGVTAAFSKVSATPTFSSSLTLTVASSTSARSYTLIVVGSGGGKTRSAALTLSVTQQSDFRVQASPSSLTISQGQVVSFVVEVISLQNFNSPVILSVTGLPQGSYSVFSVNSETPNYVSVLTVTLPRNVQTGPFTPTIKAQGGGLTRTTQISLTIEPAVQTQTLTQTQTQTATQTLTETSTHTQTQTQTETQTETSYPLEDLLATVQENSLAIIGILALIIILLAAAALRGARRVSTPEEPA